MGASGSSNQKKRIKGGEWKYKVYFDPEADRGDLKIDEFADGDLMVRLKDIVGVNEDIQRVETYKSPIFKWQLTNVFLYHMFVLFKTASWCWTIEKNSEGLTIQRSRRYETVKDKYRRRERLPTTLLDADNGRCTVYDLIGWLYKSDALNRKYDLTTSNCQHFGTAVFEYVRATRCTNIAFEPEVDEEKGYRKELTDDAFMDGLRFIEGVHEHIETACIINLRHARLPFNTNIAFVFFQTPTWCWSIKRNKDVITIKRSKKKEAIIDDHIHECYNQAPGQCTIYQVMNWLYKLNYFNNIILKYFSITTVLLFAFHPSAYMRLQYAPFYVATKDLQI